MTGATTLGGIAQAFAAGGTTYLHCPCNDKTLHYFPSKTIIRCPECRTWQHKAHVGIDDNDITAGIGYICKSCMILGDEANQKVKRMVKDNVNGWKHLSHDQIRRLVGAEEASMTDKEKMKLKELESFTQMVSPKKRPRKQKPGISPFLGLNKHDSIDDMKRILPTEVTKSLTKVDWVAKMHKKAETIEQQPEEAARKAALDKVGMNTSSDETKADEDDGEEDEAAAKKEVARTKKAIGETWVRRSSRHLRTNTEDIEIEDKELEI